METKLDKGSEIATMLQMEFSQEEIAELNKERLNHPNLRVRKRMEVLYNKSQGKSHQEIGATVGITQTTVRSYLKIYQAGGIEALKAFSFYRRQSELEPHKAAIVKSFEAEPVTTMKEAAHRIEKLTNVKRSSDQVRRYLTSLGLKRLKTGQLPAKADPAAQEDFLKKN